MEKKPRSARLRCPGPARIPAGQPGVLPVVVAACGGGPPPGGGATTATRRSTEFFPPAVPRTRRPARHWRPARRWCRRSRDPPSRATAARSRARRQCGPRPARTPCARRARRIAPAPSTAPARSAPRCRARPGPGRALRTRAQHLVIALPGEQAPGDDGQQRVLRGQHPVQLVAVRRRHRLADSAAAQQLLQQALAVQALQFQPQARADATRPPSSARRRSSSSGISISGGAGLRRQHAHGKMAGQRSSCPDGNEIRHTHVLPEASLPFCPVAPASRTRPSCGRVVTDR